MKIDAHQHYWKISRGDYFWMDDSVCAIRKDFGPDDLASTRAKLGVEGTIVVQATPTLAETRYLLDLYDANTSILGVVGWLDLEVQNIGKILDELCAHPGFKGVRPMLQDIEDTDWVLQPHVINNLNDIARRGLRMDALITPRHLDVIDQLAKMLPTLPIVIDHCAKPLIADGHDAGEAWRQGVRTLSRHPQVFCKLSGIASEYGAGWNAAQLKPIFNHVLHCFGPDRLMWGSDWPVLNLAGDYQTWHDCAQKLAEDLPQGEKERLFGDTARDFYGLDAHCDI